MPAASKTTRKPKIIVRTSRIHGRGVYAGRNLKKGGRIIEYKGEVIGWREADRRPPSDPDDPNTPSSSRSTTASTSSTPT